MSSKRRKKEVRPEVEICKSEVDGTWVVQIDTQNMPENELGPKLRVYLNDFCLHENPPFPERNQMDAEVGFLVHDRQFCIMYVDVVLHITLRGLLLNGKES